MKVGVVVNVMDSDQAGATTYRLAAEAINSGHEVWVMSTNYMRYYRRNFSNIELATL